MNEPHLLKITDPCRYTYASKRECGLPVAVHRPNNGSLTRGPQHDWSPLPVSVQRCVQCGVALTGWSHPWPTGAESCQDCYYADWGV